MSASTSPLPYTGNKSCIVNTILTVMPKHSVYIEPCMGSAEVFFRKPKAEREILNDYNGDLVNLFRTIQSNKKLVFLLGRLYLSINSELIFRQNKERLRNIPNVLDDVLDTSQIISKLKWSEVEAAAAFFENQVYSFSSTGQTFGIARRDMSQRLDRLINAYGRMRDAIILHRDYKDVISYAACPGSFILLDPPYKGTEGMYSKANFDSDQHAVLFDFMGEINEKYQGEAKFLITYNNDPYIELRRCDLLLINKALRVLQEQRSRTITHTLGNMQDIIDNDPLYCRAESLLELIDGLLDKTSSEVHSHVEQGLK